MKMNKPLTVREAPASYLVELEEQRVRPGYKQTEVGVIPEDWDVDTIVNLAAITTGDKNTQDRIEDGAYPFFVRSSTVERINSYTFDGEAVLTAGDGVGTGKIFHYINGKFDFHQRVYKISNFSDRLIGQYFYLYFSNNFYSRIMQMTAKSSVDSVRRDMIADMKIPVPLPDEQRAIAAALSDVDALLAKLDQLIAKKRDLKQAAMQQLLTGSTRLPGFGGEWEVKRLGDVVEIRKGQLITEKGAIEGDVPVIAGGKKPSYFHNQPNRSGKTITVSASGASAGYVAFFDTPIFASDCSTIDESKEYSIEFIYFQLLLKQNVIYKAQTGGAQPHIHAVDLRPIEIGGCSVQEQTAIATILSDMDAEIAALEARRDKTRDLKQGMMQELLTGRIRLV